MIKTEQVYDIKENMIEKDKVIKLPERDKDVQKNDYKVDPKSNTCWIQRKTDSEEMLGIEIICPLTG